MMYPKLDSIYLRGTIEEGSENELELGLSQDMCKAAPFLNGLTASETNGGRNSPKS